MTNLGPNLSVKKPYSYIQIKNTMFTQIQKQVILGP